MSKRIGVILSGCGYLDGSEINEAVLTLLHLDEAGCEVTVFAPRKAQADVVDHATGDAVEGETRDVFVEAARIARGKITDLAEADAEALEGLIVPGGFGAAKNLSDFASAGAEAQVDPQVAGLMRAMHEAQKPIGVVCIAPAVCAAVFRGTEVNPTLTIGEDEGTAAALEQMGAQHVESPVTGIAVDEVNKIVSTPAYMYDARLADASVGIGKLVAAVVSMA